MFAKAATSCRRGSAMPRSMLSRPPTCEIQAMVKLLKVAGVLIWTIGFILAWVVADKTNTEFGGLLVGLLVVFTSGAFFYGMAAIVETLRHIAKHLEVLELHRGSTKREST